MQLSKKIISIVLSSMLILFSLFLLITTIIIGTNLADYVKAATESGHANMYKLSINMLSGATVIGVILTIFAAVYGGRGLARSIKGEVYILRHGVLFASFVFIQGIAALCLIVSNSAIFEKAAGEYIVTFIMLFLLMCGTIIVSEVGTRKSLQPGKSKLTGGVLLIITFGLILALLIFYASNKYLNSLQHLCKNEQVNVIDLLYGFMTALGYLASFGFLAIGVINIVEYNLETKKSTPAQNDAKIQISEGSKEEDNKI